MLNGINQAIPRIRRSGQYRVLADTGQQLNASTITSRRWDANGPYSALRINVLVWNPSVNGVNVNFTFFANGDTLLSAANYYYTFTSGNGTGAASGFNSGITAFPFLSSGGSGNPHVCVIDFPDSTVFVTSGGGISGGVRFNVMSSITDSAGNNYTVTNNAGYNNNSFVGPVTGLSITASSGTLNARIIAEGY